ncbi:ATP-dependent RNA helicase HrpB [Caulifigura coniformis]|uniref:ATP-dependent RNA helicase HrpB n=1 Tax=Caulifigura coniformis TaxID=2527983 RepID=A0A517SF53_9PLAN|nr:ATP-dependent helicase HrpB [Caulifigura coniformis]QDT54720.1 ATP-dependent RNA helicase HrpB [Caulifigura coniformis]
MLSPLPIDDVLPAVASALANANSLVLQAPPGAGKTTRVPPVVADAGWAAGKLVIMLEPRRMAARAAARRIAEERGGVVGGEVGYQVRFDEKKSRDTRILVVTEGVFLRRIQSDPFLDGVAAVLFDEFHERNLLSDIALGMVRRVQQTVRPDLRSLLMSATLDPEPIARALGGCPVVRSEGRAFPVEVKYLGRSPREPLPSAVAAVIEKAVTTADGDVLVFLPGVGEIHRTAGEVEPLARQLGLAVMPLYGDMPPEEQDAVLAPCPRRKVVLSTNVAETSLTIDGVRIVVDSGLARIMRYDPQSGLDKLELSNISKASADQRAGRAGRTAPGVCWRMWDEAAQRSRPDRELPEIARVDLASAVLMLKDWGETEVLAFPWLDPPFADSVRLAERLLQRLEAIDEDGAVTPLGQTLARLPTHPRLARLVVEGHRRGDARRVSLLAAYLSERDPFSNPRHGGGRPSSLATARSTRSHSDVVDRLTAIERFLSTGQDQTPWGELHRGGTRLIQQAADQLRRTADAELGRVNEVNPASDEIVMRCLLAAYPDRLAKRRDRGSDRAIMVGGRGVKLAPGSCVTDADLFVCVDIMDAQPDAVVRLASAVERDWLPPELIRTSDEVFFHPSQKQIVARRRVLWDDLVLSETPIATPEDDATAEALYEAAKSSWSSVFPDDADVAGYLARVQSLADWMPDLDLPAFDESQRLAVLRGLCNGRRSFAELRSAPWLNAIKNSLTWEQMQTIDREAPERIGLPSGKSSRVTYEPGRPPVLAARIQDFFGLRETPRIAGGRVKVLLHLLAPNMRAQQVTDDLPSFWANTYSEVRKELRRRYPKHKWPEDPTEMFRE